MTPKIKHDKLQKRITDVCKANVNFAILMGISNKTLIKKLKDDGVWTTSEISKACEILNINKSEITDYFFKY